MDNLDDENEKPSFWTYFSFLLLGILIGTFVFPARKGFSIIR